MFSISRIWSGEQEPPKCPECAKPIGENHKFCLHCGHQVKYPRKMKERKERSNSRRPPYDKFCPKCVEGRAARSRDGQLVWPSFCHKCGTKLQDVPR